MPSQLYVSNSRVRKKNTKTARTVTEAVSLTDSLNRRIPARAAIEVVEKPQDQGE